MDALAPPEKMSYHSSFATLWVCSLLLLLSRRTTSIDTWCGKAYRPSDPATDPGGCIDKHSLSPAPVLALEIRPHVQPYLEEDVNGAFIIDAPLSYIRSVTGGSILLKWQKALDTNLLSNVSELDLISYDIFRTDTGGRIFGPALVALNSSGNTVGFSLAEFKPSLIPYNISLMASDTAGYSYTATTQLLRLPGRTDGGSVTKIDNLYGSLLTKGTIWKPLFPYSFYLNGNWLAEDPNNMARLRSYGYNVLHIVPAGGLGYNFTQLDEWLDEAQRVGLWLMYDMRWTYQNSTLVEWQVNRLKARPNLLLWYTADEPGMSNGCIQ